MAEMKFEVGQNVVIRKALGSANGRPQGVYYYGGNVREVPLGATATIGRICENDRIELLLGNNPNRYSKWFAHPDELYTPEEREIAEKQEQERFNSNLENALLSETPTIQETHISSKSFNPKFNKKEEFVVWVRQEFPELKEYAENGQKYEVLIKRIDEVQDAAQVAWKGVEESTTLMGSNRHCQRNFISPRYHQAVNELDVCKKAAALENFVRTLELSGTKGFPYSHNMAPKDAESLKEIK